VTVVRLNVMNFEFLGHVSRKVEEVHSRQAAIAIAIVRAHDVGPKRIGRDGDAIARGGGKQDVRLGIGTRQRIGHTGGRNPADCENRQLFKKRASSR